MEPKKAYWAGDLFDLKDLIGNRMLADAFEREAGGSLPGRFPDDRIRAIVARRFSAADDRK